MVQKRPEVVPHLRDLSNNIDIRNKARPFSAALDARLDAEIAHQEVIIERSTDQMRRAQDVQKYANKMAELLEAVERSGGDTSE